MPLGWTLDERTRLCAHRCFLKTKTEALLAYFCSLGSCYYTFWACGESCGSSHLDCNSLLQVSWLLFPFIHQWLRTRENPLRQQELYPESHFVLLNRSHSTKHVDCDSYEWLPCINSDFSFQKINTNADLILPQSPLTRILKRKALIYTHGHLSKLTLAVCSLSLQICSEPWIKNVFIRSSCYWQLRQAVHWGPVTLMR